MKLNNDYEVNARTIYIENAYHEHFRTKINDIDGIFFSTKSAIQLLDDACLDDCADYRSRRRAVKEGVGIHQKIPIPVIPIEKVYAVPTHSPNHDDNVWFFAEYYLYCKPLGKEKAEIFFNNGSSLIVSVSAYTIERQIERAGRCILRFSPINHLGFWLNKPSHIR
ncbi:competence protein ComK [Ferdinandcohnia quinoae]|uniref:Competence protein ComK n=1 Tax=Fredinandcohnia quinoae TaxID=2918902 RepID=A0AAW5ECK9_9BACI|nr:competence protein ComK [Fredinandcohnia sp. SECRCQ15]MCH1627732.1 competence protein ComK [Fredinandcohnia sp. SECRCQ15]